MNEPDTGGLLSYLIAALGAAYTWAGSVDWVWIMTVLLLLCRLAVDLPKAYRAIFGKRNDPDR